MLEVVPEERERLDERSAARHYLGSSSREQIERGEILEDTHRIVRAEHGHSAGETDFLRARCGGREDDGGARYDIVRAVVLANSEYVEAELVGELDLLDQIAESLRCNYAPVRCRIRIRFSECINPQLHKLTRCRCRCPLRRCPYPYLLAASRLPFPASRYPMRVARYPLKPE